MPEERSPALRLVRGGDGAGNSGDPGGGGTAAAQARPRPRPGGRRSAIRRTPVWQDPIEDLLRHLDEEPSVAPGSPAAEDPAPPDDPAVSAEPAEEPAVAKPRRTVKHRSLAGRTPARQRPEHSPPVGKRPVKRRPAPASRPRLVTVALAVAVCAALAVAVVAGQRWYGDTRVDRAHQQALAAAKQTTVDFVSVSAASVDRDLQRILNGATGDFKDEFGRGQAQLRAAIVENAVQSQGTVLRAGLVSGGLRSAVVLVAVDATVKNSKTPAGRVSHYRIQVDVSRDPGSGRWLVARLQFVG